MITGSCLCGGVAYEISGTPSNATHCHCTRCQKVRGTGHATNMIVPLDGVRFTRGAELLTTYRHPEAKHFAHVFCKVCGASQPRFDEARGFVIVPMGSLDADPGIRPGRHIWVDSMPAWDSIEDELPRFGGPPVVLFEK